MLIYSLDFCVYNLLYIKLYVSDKQNVKRTFDLLAIGGITLAIDISPRHFLELTSDHLRWSQNEWRLNFVKASLDMADIITIEGFQLTRLEDSKEVRLERQNNEGFELEWNETWALTIESAKARFPYEHQFTEAIQNELFSIRKWLKELHSFGKKTKTKSLPCDLVIKVIFLFRSFLFPIPLFFYLKILFLDQRMGF